MPAIPLPLSSSPGERAAETQGRLVNLYAIKEGDRLLHKQTPGLTSFATSTETGFRGALQVGSSLYVVRDNKVVRYDSTGAETVLTGTLDGTGPVTIQQNNKSPTPDIMAVDKDNGAFSITSSAVSTFSDSDLPAVQTVAYLDGYFLTTTGAGQIWATGLNGVTVDPLSFAGAEAKPDGLTRGFVSGQLFYGCGPESTEIWQNVGASPFPLGRVAVVAVGIRGPWCIAGDQAGWDSGPIMVANDGTVRKWNGYQPQEISTPAVVRDILSITDTDDLRASVYVVGDQAVWVLRSSEWTWAYNVSTGLWHQIESNQLSNWRAVGSVKAFDRWICGDTADGTLWTIDAAGEREGQNDINRMIESLAAKGFPAGYPIYRADFDMVVGQGSESGIDPIQTNPRIRISWSDDGGNTWSTPVVRTLGRQGNYKRLVSIAGVGRSTHTGRRWRIEKSDPVYWSLLGATFNEKVNV